MIRLLRHLRARRLNLDLDDRELLEGGIDDAPLPTRDFWRLMRLLFRQALGDGASAIHLCCDGEDDCCHMRYHVAGVWYEMVPPPPRVTRQAIRSLRKKSRIAGFRQDGELPYIRDGSILSAHCVSPNPDALCVYFTDARPTPLNKQAGDRTDIRASGLTS